MKSFGLLVVTLIAGLSLSFSALAQEYGIFGGFNSTEMDSSRSWDREFGLEFGGTALIPLQGDLSIRTGAGFVQKNSSSKVAGTKLDVKLSYLEIPATLFYAATKSIGIFGGLNLDLKIADDCEIGSGSFDCDAETISVNLPLGARFNIQDQHNIEPILELGVTDVARDTKIGNSLSIRYIYMFGKM